MLHVRPALRYQMQTIRGPGFMAAARTTVYPLTWMCSRVLYADGVAEQRAVSWAVAQEEPYQVTVQATTTMERQKTNQGRSRMDVHITLGANAWLVGDADIPS
jgi:hypothetical protein